MRVAWACGLFFSSAVTMAACSASKSMDGTDGSGAGSGTGTGTTCGDCVGLTYTPCDGPPVECTTPVCAPGLGCVLCTPNELVCVGDEVHRCAADGMSMDELVETCDVAAALTCHEGACQDACTVADTQPSNIGCEFWAADLDQQDGFNDPASAPWGVVLSNTSQAVAHVTIELNDAPYGEPPVPTVVQEVDVAAGDLAQLVLPTRELDCGIMPNDYASPGTCLSSQAFRIKSSTPIVVYQFNVFENAYSNDASLLLPSNALGRLYRVLGWPAGHPAVLPIGNILDRAYVTIVGVTPNTQVTVKPSWRIKGNPPIAQTMPGGEIVATIGPFDVLNLETDDAALGEVNQGIGVDLSGTIVSSSAPVAVFSGVETTQAPGLVEVPKSPSWIEEDTCCLDHLEEQMFPVESVGKKYLATRSPIRSTTGWREPDVIRFVGVAETANVTTSLPAPYDHFTLLPGEVKTTWTQSDVVIDSDKPIQVGQILVSNEYCEGAYIGDPSLTVFAPVEQFRTEYLLLTPGSWDQSFIVIGAEVGKAVTIDGVSPAGCIVEAAGDLDGKTWESRRCPVAQGTHRLSGEAAFGIIAYGYGTAGSYAFVGGADVKPIYEPPPLE
jgi:hypothetical protein